MFGRDMIPAVKEFPRDGRFWRIDWFGGVERNAHSPDEPHIQVVISPILIELPALPKALASVHATNPREQRTIAVGIGLLPYLTIGSIWKDGRVLPCCAGETKTFENLLVSDESVVLHNTNKRLGHDWLIPRRHYWIHHELKGFCLALPHQGDPYGIIIPATELLRFYYATSSPLSRDLLNGRFVHDINEIVNLRKCGISSDGAEAWLQLRTGARKNDRWTIARILFDPKALACVRGLCRSMVAQRSKGSVVFLPANFPFNGYTNLTARIKRIPVSGNRWRFFVLSLRNCTAKFPFGKLSFSADNDVKKLEIPESTRPGQIELIESPASPTKKSKIKYVLTQRSQDEVQGLFDMIYLPLPEERFSDLRNKPYQNVYQEKCFYFGVNQNPTLTSSH